MCENERLLHGDGDVVAGHIMLLRYFLEREKRSLHGQNQVPNSSSAPLQQSCGQKSRRKLIFINRYFFPDHSATSQILGDLAFHLAKQAEDVHVITSRQLYDNKDVRLSSHECINGVTVHRVATTRFGRGHLLGRGSDYFSFYFSAAWELFRFGRQGDVVVVKTDPPMLSVFIAPVALMRRIIFVNWLQDLYPEIAAKLGVWAAGGLTGWALIRMRNASLRCAAMNVAIGDDMREHLCTLGLPRDKVCVVQNWADDEHIVPSARANSLRELWALQNKFVVGYSGNLGRAHDVSTLLDAAEVLKKRTEIVFLFIGSGRGLVELDAEAKQRRLPNIVCKPYQPRELLSQSLAVADVHWLSLKPGLDGLILPSKFYGVAAAGRPMVIVGSPAGELAKLVVQFECGIHVAWGQSERFSNFISLLAENPQHCRQMGSNARRLLEQRFTKAQSLDRWHAMLRSVVDGQQETMRPLSSMKVKRKSEALGS
jgi:glycosyltransferase involved in cell wall biosynthesis